MGKLATVTPAATDTELAVEALRRLVPALEGEGPAELRVGNVDVVVPRSAVEVLAEVLSSFAHGESVTVLPGRSELTTQQAADALNVSRPFLIRLLDAGEIGYRTVGTHRRVDAASLIRFRSADDARRLAVADELSAEAFELGLT